MCNPRARAIGTPLVLICRCCINDRFVLGEGIEKKVVDLAKEVEEQKAAVAAQAEAEAAAAAAAPPADAPAEDKPKVQVQPQVRYSPTKYFLHAVLHTAICKSASTAGCKAT